MSSIVSQLRLSSRRSPHLLVTLGLSFTLSTACGNGSDDPLADAASTAGAAGAATADGLAGAGGASAGATSSGGTGMTDLNTGGANDVADGQAGAANLPVTAAAPCVGSTAAPGDSAQHSIGVDTGNTWGALPHFWNTYGTGHLDLYLREDRQWGDLLQAHTADAVENLGLTSVRQHGLFHEDVGIYHEVDGEPVYDFTRSDQIFDFFVEQGIKPIVELGSMPRDLAADPSAVEFDWETGISPPKDFQRWHDLVFEFVSHSVERYGAEVVIEWYFEVWNEPECCSGKFWTGTLDQYYELFDYAAAAVRSALPGARVGGPSASQPKELTMNSAIGQGFLEHVTTDNYVTPGTPGQLDFFTYHSWSFVKGSVDGYFEGLNLLDSFGLDVGIAITEFGPTWEFGLYDEPQESRQGAAFVAQTYADISRRCAQEGKRFPIAYSWWVLSDVFEEGLYREDDPFIGCMGLTSRENIHKPAYNAYKFLAQMGDEQMPFTVSGAGGVGGMAARDASGQLQVLLYNGQNPGLGPSDDKYYDVSGAHTIDVVVAGLAPGVTYDVMTYRVDETRGNAYATWEGQGRPSMTDMSEPDWQALRDTMDSPAEPLEQALCAADETLNYRFELPSPGVLFVTLTPSAP